MYILSNLKLFMRIIIAGAGEVGFHLAKLLSFEAHDITLIDEKSERLHYADLRLDIKVMKAKNSGR